MRETSLQSVYELAKIDERVVFIGSDLGPKTLERFRQEMPDRFFMEGISEQHIIGMAAGLAMEGFIPYFFTISTFLSRRCFEQIVINLCFQNLPVRLIGFGGGVVYAPLGPTHLATEDFAILRALPNMTIIAPSDADEMKRLIPKTLNWAQPIYIRMARGEDPIISRDDIDFEIGKAILLQPPREILIIATGIMTTEALKVSESLFKKGIQAGILHVHTIKPLDRESILKYVVNTDLVVILEEHYLSGGFSSAILELLVDSLYPLPKIIRMGLPDKIIDGYGVQEDILSTYNLQAPQIEEAIIKAIRK